MSRMITFSEPFCYTIDVEAAPYCCYYCLKKLPKTYQAKTCTGCRFANFCDENCSERGRKWHDAEECELLQQCYPTAPLTSVLLYSRLLRILRKNNVKVDDETLDAKERNWARLMTNMDSMKNDILKMKSANIFHQMVEQFLGETYQISPDEFLYVYCKKNINTHGIYNNFGVFVGEAIDLDGSAYDHSCRPTVAVSFDGFRMTFQSIDPAVDVTDISKAFVSYTELAQSKFKRQKDLLDKYCFECRCVRCLDPDDDKLVSVRCSNDNCNEPIVFFENKPAVATKCPKCNFVISKESIEAALYCIEMIEKTISEEMVMDSGQSLFNYVSTVLHPLNVYMADLCTIFLQEALKKKDKLRQALDLGVFVVPCLRMCYPKNHKCLALHLLKLAYVLVLFDELNRAAKYVDESLKIMKVWFGDEYFACQQLEKLLSKLTTKSDCTMSSDLLLQYFKFE